MTEPTFSNQTEQPLQLLQRVFGYEQFRAQQADIIECLIQGNDALVLMPTGGGKSLCYQIPALIRPGMGIVISPLIALMQDQVAALRQNGVRAAFLNSSLDAGKCLSIEQAIYAGAIDLLYIAPERLLKPRTLQWLGHVKLSLFAIDEAHCVSQWGHDFRPEYIRLALLRKHFPGVPRVALTATADKSTRCEIITRLELDQVHAFIGSFDRPNIRYQVAEGGRGDRERLLEFIHTEHPGESGIVYCLSRRRVEEIAAWLNRQGLPALSYHAGLDSQIRARHQTRFVTDEGVIMVATVAFGMGIDKPDVRFVAHLNLPRSLEAYYQETGRAGRDGLPADAWMLYGIKDVLTLRQLQAQSRADPAHKRTEQYKLEAILGFCELTSCRRQALLRYFGEQAPEPCGNCDNCLNPPQTWDATEPARKALSCAYRTGQRFGVNYLIDVLLGKNDKRIHQFGHNRISTFGIGREKTALTWRGIFRQLIARGLLNVNIEGHGGLRLTESSRPVLRGESTLHLRVRNHRQQCPERRPPPQISVLDHTLWEKLRACRKRLAQAQGVPAYIIFNDATLLQIMKLRPHSLTDLGKVAGVGERKLAAYGDTFIALFEQPKPLA